MAKRKRSKTEKAIAAPDWLTAGYVWNLYQLRRDDGDERSLRLEMQEMRELVAMRKKPRIPKEYQAITQEIRTSFVKDAHEHVAGAIMQNDPVPHIEPSEDKDEYRRAAAVGERWTDAAFHEMSDSVGEDVGWEFCKQLVRDREAVIKIVHRPDAWANFPDRKQDETADDFLKRTTPYKKGSAFPAAWKTIDRKQMVFEDGEFGSSWAIEYGEYPRPHLMTQYKMMPGSDGKLVDPATTLGAGSPAPEGELNTVAGRSVKLEYFDQEWWHVVIDGSDAPGYPKLNPYMGCPNNGIPYFQAKVSANPLVALRWLQPALDSLLTMHLNWAYLGAYPIPKVTAQPNSLAPSLGLEGGVPGGEDEQPATVEWKPGKAFFPPPGYDLTFVSPPPIGPDVSVMEERLRSLIDIAGIPSVLRGGAGADASGYLANQLISAAIMRFRQLVKALQRAFSLMGEFLWWIVDEKVQQEVFVLEQEEGETDRLGKPKKNRRAASTWLSLTPDGPVTGTSAPTTHFAKFVYRFRPVLPTDDQARAMIALQVTNSPKPLYSRKRALEKFMQEEDPEGVLDDVYVENTLDNDPQIHQTVVENAMRKAGFPAPGQGNPASQLIDIHGKPLIPGGGAPIPSAYSPGQARDGQAAVPGLTMPLQPGAPGPGPALGGKNSAGHAGGRPAGSYPGAPGNQGPAAA